MTWYLNSNLFEDNEPVKTIATTGRRNNRKGMERDAFWICEKTAAGIISPASISTNDQVADILTKNNHFDEDQSPSSTNIAPALGSSLPRNIASFGL